MQSLKQTDTLYQKVERDVNQSIQPRGLIFSNAVSVGETVNYTWPNGLHPKHLLSSEEQQTGEQKATVMTPNSVRTLGYLLRFQYHR